MRSEFLTVAEQVLEQEKRPMRPKEIVAIAVKRKLFSSNIAGKTPHQTLKSKLSVDVRRNADDSIFVRTAPGKFYLRRLLPLGQDEYKAHPYEKPRSRELVLVFPTGHLDERGRFQGVKKSWKRLYRYLLRPEVCTYMPRTQAEAQETQKQVLTYIMITRRGSVLAFKRGQYTLTDEFLRGSHCIGFGGHVVKDDVAPLFGSENMGVTEGAIRELSEEVMLPTRDRNRLQYGEGLQCVGILNDDSSVVGQRHLAILFRYEVSRDPGWQAPVRGEKSITQLRWLNLRKAPIAIWNFEYWSQLCLRDFFPRLVETAPAYRVLRGVPLCPPHILCVLGAVGSGKSEATTMLKEEYGYTEVNTGAVMANLLAIPPIPSTPRAHFQSLAWKFIQAPGAPASLAGAILAEARAARSGRIVVDGIRQRETLNMLRNFAGRTRVGVVFVHTLPDLAYHFYRQREQKGVSILDFLRIRGAEVEREVEDLIDMSDAVLYNWTGRVRYRHTLRALMRHVNTS